MVSVPTAAWLTSLPEKQRKKFLAELSAREKAQLLFKWSWWARPNQLPPEGDWFIHLILAGRGWGKSRTGAEWIRSKVESGKARRIALVGRTAADVRDVMVRGQSGLIAVSPPEFRPEYEPSKRLLTWPNGAIATCYTSDEPDNLRGPEHDCAWADEVASWQRPEAWDMLLLGLRLGAQPQVVATTTPKPIKLVRELTEKARRDSSVVITRGSTYLHADGLSARGVAEGSYYQHPIGRNECAQVVV